MNNFLTILYPVLNVCVVGILGYIGQAVVRVLPKVVTFIEVKIGVANYTKMQLVAKSVWNIVEENFRLGDLENSKIVEFQTLITAKFPAITSAQIENLRQDIAGEVNKDKPLVIKTVAPTPVPIEAVAPIIKYFAADGITELKPVLAQ